MSIRKAEKVQSSATQTTVTAIARTTFQQDEMQQATPLIAQTECLSPIQFHAQNNDGQKPQLFTDVSTRSKNGILLPVFLPSDLIPTAAALKDCAIWFGMKQAHIITNIVQWRKHALFCGELQEQLDQEIKMFDQVRYLFDDGEKYSLSRRQVLMSIAMLPVALLKTTQQGSWYRFDIEEFLPRCTASITAVWHLLKGREFIAVEEVLLECLPTLITLSRKPSPYQETAAQLATQTCLLMSLMSRHHGNNLALDEWYSREAVFYSEITTNRLLKIGTLKQLADTCYYRENYGDMLLAYEKAWQYILTVPQTEKIPSLIHARVCSGLAYACVKNGDTERAKSLLSQAHEMLPQATSVVDDQTPLYADCGVHSLYLWGGLTRRLLDQPEEAGKTFALVEQLPLMNILVPERTHVEIITHQAATAIIQGEMEIFCSYLTATMDGIAHIKSEQRRQEAVHVYQQARQKWPDEKPVLQLADLFVPLH